MVADGATGRSVADLPAGIPLEKPGLWTMFTTIRLLSGTAPGPPLGRLVADISSTPLLLVAAGSIPAERALNGGYAATAAEPVELWDLPDVTHTAAIRERADAYERRVISYFERALDPSRAHGPTALHRQR